MPTYAVFLRGVSPLTLKMADLRGALEAAGLEDVRTVLASGNAVFGAARGDEAALERRVAAAVAARAGRPFPAFVRRLDALATLLASDPYRGCEPAPGAKRVVTFLREAPARRPRLPVVRDGSRIVNIEGREAFGDYLPGPRGPVFMALIEDTFGDQVTTRTWETVRKVAAAGGAR